MRKIVILAFAMLVCIGLSSCTVLYPTGDPAYRSSNTYYYPSYRYDVYYYRPAPAPKRYYHPAPAPKRYYRPAPPPRGHQFDRHQPTHNSKPHYGKPSKPPRPTPPPQNKNPRPNSGRKR
jgi:hypothetical protein